MSSSFQGQPDPKLDGLKLEYSTLRSEINIRIGLRQNLISITLTIAGVILGFGVKDNGVIALVYPPLALFLAIAWMQNDGRARDVADHIRKHIEPEVPGLSWETRIEADREPARKANKRRSTLVSHGGVFLITQFMAVMIGVLQFKSSPLEWVLLVVDLVAVLFVAKMLLQYKR